ncbi:MAG TPA: HNH endonuclease signature motif containing protein [Acidimicrobiales bacterium]|nr:HNH endonuclease signature motif containing protein [Acidimicrobiales bacterium]
MFESPTVEWLQGVRVAAAGLLTELDVDVLSASDAAALVTEVARTERCLAAIRVIAARRAADADTWRQSGAASPEAWLARQTGTTTSQAAASLETSRALGSAPGTDAALRAGDISEAQAGALAAAATADPASEQKPLGEAATTNLEGLKRRSREVRAAARPDDTATAQARVHAGRFCRTWSDDEGGVNGRFRLTAIAGARFKAVLDHFHREAFEAVRAAGGRERPGVIAADALVAMADEAAGGGEVGAHEGVGGAARSTGPGAPGGGAAGGGEAGGGTAGGGAAGDRRPTGGRTGRRSGGVRPTIFVRVDLSALERGHTVAGEDCGIDGVGPVPVSTVRSMWAEAVLAAVVTDGPRIIDLRLPGRTMPRRLRLAVVARDRQCVVPGCRSSRRVELHHLHAVADGGGTHLDGLALLCGWHHDQITYAGARLTGPPGAWTYTPPPFGHPDDPPGGPFDDGFLEVHRRRRPHTPGQAA